MCAYVEDAPRGAHTAPRSGLKLKRCLADRQCHLWLMSNVVYSTLSTLLHHRLGKNGCWSLSCPTTARSEASPQRTARSPHRLRNLGLEDLAPENLGNVCQVSAGRDWRYRVPPASLAPRTIIVSYSRLQYVHKFR